MPVTFRDFTPYEREKWLDNLGRFEFGEDAPSPHFLSYGDELGEAFDAALGCSDLTDYGLSDEFVHAARIQVLDMYYDQILLYTGSYSQDRPEDLGLPPQEVFANEAKTFGVEGLANFGQERSDDERRLWDWAMQWREEHAEETENKRRADALRAELERLERKAAR